MFFLGGGKCLILVKTSFLKTFTRIYVAKSAKELRHVRPSVLPHALIRLPLDRFAPNMIFETFIQLCLEYPHIRVTSYHMRVTYYMRGTSYHIRETLYWGHLIALLLFHLVRILYCGCCNIFCKVWVFLTIVWVFW